MTIVVRDRSTSAAGCDEVHSGSVALQLRQQRFGVGLARRDRDPLQRVLARDEVDDAPVRESRHDEPRHRAKRRGGVERRDSVPRSTRTRGWPAARPPRPAPGPPARRPGAWHARPPAWRRSPMSRAIFDAPMMRPIGVSDGRYRQGDVDRRAVASGGVRSPGARWFPRDAGAAGRRLPPLAVGGTIILIDRPIASCAVKPNSRSAAGFHAVMVPSRSLPTIASSDERTMAASRIEASSALLAVRGVFEQSGETFRRRKDPSPEPAPVGL